MGEDRTDAVAARPPLMTPAEAAATLQVVPRTVARWAEDGRLEVLRTPGGHRRYPAESVTDLATTQQVAPGQLGGEGLTR